MKGSRKTEVPSEFMNWLGLSDGTENWKPTYEGMPGALKDVIRAAMFKEQRGLCVYCGRKLNLSRPGRSYHIEHFRPQHVYTKQDVDYSNLFLSCGQEDEKGLPAPTCGTVKAGWFDEDKHIYPEYPNCTSRFRFLLNGNIVAARKSDIAAEEMIARLGLDHPELKKDREDILFDIDAGSVTTDEYWDGATKTAESYAHMVFQYAGREMP
ncbi:retron system putative HNH endonuclease [Affinirhizobium pseudoryzae]|uniref:retron system putative HNH endonuclease n=1 Tax=Allorhizobium pseudoryzae TaxID=379684 RepID=UPI0013ED32C9|nr:retron system putative HNH endonuclease [Allorhizobium pseudoryzae]